VAHCRTEVSGIAQAISAYERDTKKYPPAGSLVQALSAKGKNGKAYYEFPKDQVSGGQPVDPWGHPLIYKVGGKKGKAFELYSVGPDGKDDGSSGDDISY